MMCSRKSEGEKLVLLLNSTVDACLFLIRWF